MIGLLLGGASSLWDDIRRFRQVFGFEFSGMLSDPPARGVVIATNAAGVHYPGPVDHWVTRHADRWLAMPKGGPGWLVQREARNGTHPPAVRWSIYQLPEDGPQVDHVIDAVGSTSGRLAAHVAITHLELAGVIACGMPMDEREHFDRPGPWRSAATFQEDWKLHEAELGDRFRSMSGWTRERHGEPTADWIRERMGV